jgi:Zn-finger nucleic acid-binding protein
MSLFHVECDDDTTSIMNCPGVECQLVVNHRDTISQGTVQYMLLQQASNMTEWMHKGKIEIEYSGMETIMATILLKIEGASAIDGGGSKTMNKEQKKYTEDVITSFLKESTMSQSNARVLGSNITSQKGSNEKDRDVDLSVKQINWIELTVNVFAIFSPPFTGSIKFDMIVISSFRSQASDFIYDITTRHYLPGSIVKGKSGEFFEGITQILVTSPSSPTSPVRNVTNGGPNNLSDNLTSSLYGLDNFILAGICFSVIFLMCVWICICNQKSRSDHIQSDGIILIDSTGKHRNRSSVIFLHVDQNSRTNQERQKVGEALLTNNKCLIAPDQSLGMEGKSSHPKSHKFLQASDSGLNGNNFSNTLNVKSSHEYQGPLIDHGQLIRKHNQERLGHASYFGKHGSSHSHSLGIKSTSAKSSDGFRGPMIDPGQLTRMHSREQLGQASNSEKHCSSHSRYLDNKSTHTNSSHGSRGPIIDYGQLNRKHNRERLEHASYFGKHGSSHSHSLGIKTTSVKSSDRSRGPMIDPGQLTRKHSREQLGQASNSEKHCSSHSRSLDNKSAHTKSSHGSRGPIIDHGQLHRKHSREQLGYYNR